MTSIDSTCRWLGGFVRVALAALALSFMVPASAFAADAPAAAGDVRVDQAVKAYADKLAADQMRVSDQAVANRLNDLLRDPTTQSLGNPDGDVALIEFFDYQCPYCKAAEPRIQKLLKDDRNVRLIVKEFPILSPESRVAAKAALASVRQGKYAAYHQAIMNHKGTLTDADIFDIAKTVGLDVDRLRRDMMAPEIADTIITNMNLARAIRVRETPTFIVGGHILTGPSAEMDFQKEVNAVRAKKG